MSYEVGINWVASGVRVFPAVSVKTLRWEEIRFISIPCGWNTDSGRESGGGCHQKVGTVRTWNGVDGQGLGAGTLAVLLCRPSCAGLDRLLSLQPLSPCKEA